jgi:D-alanyl-D-alanine carboxypeptidase
MKTKRILWIFSMAALCVLLAVIVSARMTSKSEVILGGVQGGYLTIENSIFTDPEASEEEVSTDDELAWPDIDINETQYSLIRDDPDHMLTSSYEPETNKLSEYNAYFSVEAIDYLEDFISLINDEGYKVVIGSAYVNWAWQNKRFNGLWWQYYEYGYNGVKVDKDTAVELARKSVMFPGTSEHQLGLAVDIFEKGKNDSAAAKANTEFYKFLNENCAEYGFIQRFPTKKMLLTGWDEPWHYRYVGEEAAKFIMENGLCLEEFYAHYVEDFYV